MRNFGLRRVLLLSVILCCSAFLALSARAAEQAARRPMVALTFDDGPYSPVTGRILDVWTVVQPFSWRATGCRAALRPCAVRRSWAVRSVCTHGITGA